ncbi:GNAT family N-acetyltransferase [Planosporangium sp. 12N6]|uniref:GNAT family N-acetyltransferase n=1 Tax=Planosporangium spinosum TaxID=3402278 RepID=UPI003CE99B76
MILRTARFAELDAATLYALLRLRVDVFVVEQKCPYPDVDGRDLEPGTVHLWVDHDGTAASYLRILADPDAARIGRVCTDRAHRGKGLAARTVAAALDLVGDRPCVLDAQSYLVGFYAGFGFEVSGAEFVEDGIPHVPMRRTAPRTSGAGATS